MATSEFVSDISKPSHVSNTLGKKRNGTKRRAMPEVSLERTRQEPMTEPLSPAPGKIDPSKESW